MNQEPEPGQPVWVILVTEGAVIDYPPEVYESRSRAWREAERWAWVLSGGGWAQVEQPFQGRWEIADREVRLVQVSRPAERSEDLWVGTHWTRDGYPDPEAVLFASESEARVWVVQPVGGVEPSSIDETLWFVAATFEIRGEEECSVVHLAKVCR
jgi:hypothetical protein